jgi:starch phosphorylase
MKVLCNGGLNMSILDGWWDEAYTPSNGWAIGTGADASNPILQDRQDAESLFDILQNHAIPEYYDRTNGIPLKWIERVKRSMSGLTPRFSSSRMVTEYAENFYFRNLTKASKSQEDSKSIESSARN